MIDEELNSEELAERTAASVELMAKIQPLLQGQYIGVILFSLTSLMVNVLNTIKDDDERRSALTFKIAEKLLNLKPLARRASGASTPRKPPARSS